MIGVIKVPCILVEDLPLPESWVDSLESLLGNNECIINIKSVHLKVRM